MDVVTMSKRDISDLETQDNNSLIQWPAPAKINWFLHIIGKRQDGYHNLQTVFQFLDYGDQMTFQITDDGKISRDYEFGFDEQTDISMQAATELATYTSDSVGVRIGLTKKLPIGGGLGGGSSNAATTLIALNKLWNIGLERHQLAKIGLKLGADVPVFVMGHSAWAEGVGERLTPIQLDECWFLVVNPNIHVSTAKIFAHKHLTQAPEMMKIRALENGIDFGFGENQLEQIVRTEYPEVDAIFKWLNNHGQPRMSGSGGSVFMPINDREFGERLLKNKPKDLIGFVAKGLNRHPLIDI